MKLLLSDYVGSLKERGELDAILPDLLSELGFHVIGARGDGRHFNRLTSKSVPSRHFFVWRRR